MAGTGGNIVMGTDALSADLRGGVVVIGNFDGVHKGHQAVLGEALEKARAEKVPAIVLTFEPHPRTFFRPDKPVFRLTDMREKAGILKTLGVDAVVVQAFDREFADEAPATFIERHLIRDLRASHVVTGYNFHFGKNRAGTPDYLVEAASGHGFGLTMVERFVDHGGSRISSSRIREELANGKVETAARLLGRNWTVSGEVVSGAQLGRTLGFPTANLKLPEETGLKHGIYAVHARIDGNGTLDGVASFGRRPTFDNGAVLLETFLFDFSGDLYGKHIQVEFVKFIRPEQKFDHADALVEQMHLDSAEARRAINALRSAVERG
jgi:riboflavin kinase / FMN adenylyltransferase